MIELYHYPFSTCSQKVRLVLAEKKLDFVSHEIDLIAGGQHDPEYVKLNPNHVVPTLVEAAHFEALRRHFDEPQIVELVSVCALFGFLNRWNDTMSTELESVPRSFAEGHLGASGWDVGKHR
jgi:hypothetical protein